MSEGHDALLRVYHHRYSLQIETASAQEVLDQWLTRTRKTFGIA
jgi:hypothetical protein